MKTVANIPNIRDHDVSGRPKATSAMISINIIKTMSAILNGVKADCDCMLNNLNYNKIRILTV